MCRGRGSSTGCTVPVPLPSGMLSDCKSVSDSGLVSHAPSLSHIQANEDAVFRPSSKNSFHDSRTAFELDVKPFRVLYLLKLFKFKNHLSILMLLVRKTEDICQAPTVPQSTWLEISCGLPECHSRMSKKKQQTF